MTVVRERRQQQALRLTLPPAVGGSNSNHANPWSPLLSVSSSSSSSSGSPDVDSLSDVKKLSVLGCGNGGTVYKVSHNQTGEIYALKVLRLGEDHVIGSAAAHEAKILQRVVSSEYVVRCVAVLDGSGGVITEVDGGGPCFVLEYMDGGSLQDILCKEKRLPEKAISGIVSSVLGGLQYLHRLQVVHGDIKPSNILVNTRGKVKIADFGASRIVDIHGHHQAQMMACAGTYAYMSPERMDPEGCLGSSGHECDHGYAGDVWSLGVVAMECYVGRFPLVAPGQKIDWATLMCAICLRKNVETSVVKMEMGSSPEFQSFCERCLERDWKKRATVEELLLHPFVTEYQENNGLETPLSSCLSTTARE